MILGENDRKAKPGLATAYVKTPIFGLAPVIRRNPG